MSGLPGLSTRSDLRVLDSEEDEAGRSISDYLEIAYRRRFHILLPFLVTLFASLVLAMKLPRAYRSSATILIEDQQIPREMVHTTVTDLADQRIQLIKHRVLTTKTILSIVNKYDLYPLLRQSLPDAEINKRFQESTEFALVGADVFDPQQGRENKATIAFTIAFNDTDPAKAQAVANELVSLFLGENVRVRTQRARRTTEFMSEEADKLKRHLQEIENSIAEYKQQFANSLPTLLSTNLSMIERMSTEMQQIDAQMNSVRDRIAFMNAQMVQVHSVGPDPRNGNLPILSKADQLRALKSEYMQLASRYTQAHPDVQRLRAQIRSFEPQFSERSSPELQGELARARQQLQQLRQKYSKNHPDVVAAKRQVSLLEARLHDPLAPADMKLDPKTTIGSDAATSTLNAQVKSAERDLDMLGKQKEQTLARMEELRKNVAQTPQVERGFQDLLREQKNSLRKYSELKEKALEAKLAQTLEEEQRGESFTLTEPPVIPSKPENSKRTKVLAFGGLLGLLLGAGSATVAELFDDSVRGVNALRQIAGSTPLLVVPYIQNQADWQQQQRRRKWILISAVIALIVATLIFHFVAMPLQEVWLRLMLKLGH